MTKVFASVKLIEEVQFFLLVFHVFFVITEGNHFHCNLRGLKFCFITRSPQKALVDPAEKTSVDEVLRTDGCVADVLVGIEATSQSFEVWILQGKTWTKTIEFDKLWSNKMSYLFGDLVIPQLLIFSLACSQSIP